MLLKLFFNGNPIPSSDEMGAFDPGTQILKLILAVTGEMSETVNHEILAMPAQAF